jgi:hypothetical protein
MKIQFQHQEIVRRTRKDQKIKIKILNAAINALYGPRRSNATALKSKDGMKLLTDRDAINERLREHFSELLNCPANVNEDSINKLTQHPIKEELDLVPNIQEVLTAIKQLKRGKAPGADKIPAEIYIHGVNRLAHELCKLFHTIWDRSDCGNYRGISLLSVAGKILARILLHRLIISISENYLPESQCGFRSNRSTVDMVFTLRQLQEKSREQNMDLYIMFIDYRYLLYLNICC